MPIIRPIERWCASTSLDDGSLFAATVRPSAAPKSELFASPQEFADFIAQGVSSCLTKVDLQKEDATYMPLEVETLAAHLRRTELAGVGEFYAAFLNESRTRGCGWRPVAGNPDTWAQNDGAAP